MTCRDLGQFSIPYNTKDILNSYSSAQKASKRRDMALAMAARDIDRSGNNQLNRLLAYRKERAIAPEFQEAQIERLAGDNYREKEYQRKQEEAMDWQNNFLYNTALFAKSMLEEPSRFQREDIEDMQQRLQDEGVALGQSFWNQSRSRSASRPAGSREQSLDPSGGGSAAPGVRNAFAQTDPAMAAMSTAMENPSLGQSINIEQLNVYNMLPPVEGAAVRVKPEKGGRKARGGTLDTLSREERIARVSPEEPRVSINISRIQELQGLVESGKISADQMQFLIEEDLKASVPKTKSKGGKKARPYIAGETSEGSLLLYSSDPSFKMGVGRLEGLDENAIQFAMTFESSGGGQAAGGGEAAQSDPRGSIDPQVVANAPESVMSFDDKVLRMLELFDYPNEIQGQYGPELISDDLRLDFGAWLLRHPNYPRRGDKAWKQFMSDARGGVQASGSSIQVGAGGLRF